MAEGVTQEFKVIGTRPVRHDGIDKVTGRAKYGADYAFPEMLHGKVLRSPHAHAIIKSIKVDKALALPGVKAVLTGRRACPNSPDKAEPIGEVPTNLRHAAHNVLARGKVLYNGHAVAAVVATSPHIAEEALASDRSRVRSPAAGPERARGDGARRRDFTSGASGPRSRRTNRPT